MLLIPLSTRCILDFSKNCRGFEYADILMIFYITWYLRWVAYELEWHMATQLFFLSMTDCCLFTKSFFLVNAEHCAKGEMEREREREWGSEMRLRQRRKGWESGYLDGGNPFSSKARKEKTSESLGERLLGFSPEDGVAGEKGSEMMLIKGGLLFCRNEIPIPPIRIPFPLLVKKKLTWQETHCHRFICTKHTKNPISAENQCVFCRNGPSKPARKEERVAPSQIFKKAGIGEVLVERRVNKKQLIDDMRQALNASNFCSSARGMNLLRAKSQEKGWNLKLGELVRIWKGGCCMWIVDIDDYDPCMRVFPVKTPILYEGTLLMIFKLFCENLLRFFFV